jgi:hypothetical protein
MHDPTLKRPMRKKSDKKEFGEGLREEREIKRKMLRYKSRGLAHSSLFPIFLHV